MTSQNFAAQIAELLSRAGSGPILVHSDLLRTASLVPRSLDRRAMLESHMQLLFEAAAGRPLWMPAFNYSFPQTGYFDFSKDVSQVGPLSEYFRANLASWRTQIPIFSFSGTGDAPGISQEAPLDPFGPRSAFNALVESDGSLLLYGASITSATVLHFAENIAGPPLYRYDKEFDGTIVKPDGSQKNTKLVFHVRPLNRVFAYDWDKIYRGLKNDNPLARGTAELKDVIAVPARQIVATIVEWLRSDPFYILAAETRVWVEPLCNKLGRRLRIDDFE